VTVFSLLVINEKNAHHYVTVAEIHEMVTVDE